MKNNILKLAENRYAGRKYYVLSSTNSDEYQIFIEDYYDDNNPFLADFEGKTDSNIYIKDYSQKYNFLDTDIPFWFASIRQSEYKYHKPIINYALDLVKCVTEQMDARYSVKID